LLAMNSILVKAEWDADALVWTATSEDVPGLVAESPSMEKLRPKVLAMIEELIVLNGLNFKAGDIPIHFVAHSIERLENPQAA
jgi:Domain of unknown function (DUF1902)